MLPEPDGPLIFNQARDTEDECTFRYRPMKPSVSPALHKLEILDTPSSPAINRIYRIAEQLFDIPTVDVIWLMSIGIISHQPLRESLHDNVLAADMPDDLKSLVLSGASGMFRGYNRGLLACWRR